MDMYQHDSPTAFRIVLSGEVTEADASQLFWACETAKSTLNHRELTIEVGDVSSAVPEALRLLSRLQEEGVHIRY